MNSSLFLIYRVNSNFYVFFALIYIGWKCGDVIFFNTLGSSTKLGIITDIVKENSLIIVEIKEPDGGLRIRSLQYDIEKEYICKAHYPSLKKFADKKFK
ncbi:MAG: hypothetical protein LBK29_03785 [Oscillospiraceae bacterium]|nr:hypothetical protein [Oscillospiraceae bacterium]